jgi:hypothetical protein
MVTSVSEPLLVMIRITDSAALRPSLHQWEQALRHELAAGSKLDP